METKIELENYQLAPSTVRVKGEDVYLFQVHNCADFNRTKKDANVIAEEIVKRYNSHEELVKALDDLVKDVENLFEFNLSLRKENTLDITINAAKLALGKLKQ